MKFIAIFLIRIYQKTLSFDHGFFRFLAPDGACRFHPTCSEYGIEAFQKYGFFRGGFLTVRRILRCHPWSLGGVDHP